MQCCAANPAAGVGVEEPDSFYAIRPECRDDVPRTRFKPRPGRTLSERRWHASFSEEGYLDIATVLKRVQRGGVHPTIKGAVWEFLLGCYDPKSTFDQRSQLRQQRRLEYEKLKSKCQEMEKAVGSGRIIMTPVITEDGRSIEDRTSNCAALQQDITYDLGDSSSVTEQQMDSVLSDRDVIQWKLTLHQIGLDVVRTDRALVYYESQENQAKLWDILAVYSWIDKDIGYCQGMSDLCSPIPIVLENEADAFWCFERLMRRLLMWAMEYNPNLFSMYEAETTANKSQAAVKDRKLLRQYGKFERENLKASSKDQQIPLSIFIVASVLEAKNKRLLKEARGLDDVVKILNDITGDLDAKKACKGALKIHTVYLKKQK